MKILTILLCLCIFAMSLAIVAWSVVTPLPTPDIVATKMPDLPEVSRAPELSISELNSALNKRLQGKPPEPPKVQTTQTQLPKVNLPQQLKLTSTMIVKVDGKMVTMADFSVGPDQSIACFEGEEVLQAKVLEIKKDEVKLLYRDTEFTLKINPRDLR